jgi:hypothetical protein
MGKANLHLCGFSMAQGHPHMILGHVQTRLDLFLFCSTPTVERCGFPLILISMVLYSLGLNVTSLAAQGSIVSNSLFVIISIKVCTKIARHGFDWQVFFVSPSGSFRDSYACFAINVILPSLAYLYWSMVTDSMPELGTALPLWKGPW